LNSGTVRGYVGRGTPRPYRPSQFGVNWISRLALEVVILLVVILGAGWFLMQRRRR